LLIIHGCKAPYKMTRKCYQCQKVKELEQFFRDKNKKYGRANICKSCSIKETTQYIKNHPDKAEKYKKMSYNSYNYVKEIKKNYGISEEEYSSLLKSQDNRCAICGNYETLSRRKRLCVDHNHSTKQIRGLLCYRCNMGIGYMKDDVQILQNAIGYLKKFL